MWFVAWFALEEPAGKGAAFNPANTTLKTDHVVSNFNSVGVRNYDSFDAGVDAFVRTLWVGGHARGDTSAAGGHDAYGYGALVQDGTGSGCDVRRLRQDGPGILVVLRLLRSAPRAPVPQQLCCPSTVPGKD